MSDFLSALGYLALASRLRRLSDDLMGDAARFYRVQGIEFSPKWFGLFKLLTEKSELSVGEAAAELGLTHPAISQMSKELTAEGLLTARTDARDERRRTLELTRKGRELALKMEPSWRAIEKASRGVTDDAGVDIIENLGRLEEALRKRPLADRIRSAHLSFSVRVVEMEPKHKEPFRRLNLGWIEQHFKVEPHDERMLRNPQTEIIAKGGNVLVAAQEGEVVGVVAIKPTQVGRRELMKLAVDPRNQRRGIGELLIVAALDYARDHDAKSVYLETSRKLETAVRLYRKLGFREIGLPAATECARTDLVMEIDFGS